MGTLSHRKDKLSARRDSAGKKAPVRTPAAHVRKGRIVEAVVALLHNQPGVEVECNVELSPIHGDTKRKREIDVLLTSHVAGYPVRIAFQCKNEKTPIKPEMIDAFIGALDDVGIPPEHGIFVCVNGYTRGAIDRAKVKGIRTLVLRGLTKDRLASAVADAFQFNVHLLAEVTGMTVTNDVGDSEHEGHFLVFCDDQRKTCGTVMDLILHRWRYGEPSSELGEYELNLDVPQGWHHYAGDKVASILAVSATLRVSGLVLTLPGKTKNHALINPSSQTTERSRLDVEFEIPRSGKVEHHLTAFHTEDELKKFIDRPGSVRLTSRLRLPRILCNNFYYPFSERVVKKMFDRMNASDAGDSPEPHTFTLDETEGTDLAAVWEVPWQGFLERGVPVLATDDEGNCVDVRLLMVANEYGRVTALHSQYNQYPTPEFAYLLSWAYLMQSDSLLGKAESRTDVEARRLREQAADKIRAALVVNPGMYEAWDRFGSALQKLGQYGDAVAAYDGAIALEAENYRLWADKTVPLINQEKLDEALGCADKALDLTSAPAERRHALLTRAHVHHYAARHADAVEDLMTVWKEDVSGLVENVSYHPMIEAFCVAAPSPEATLLLVETQWSRAAAEASIDNGEEARRLAERASQNLETLVRFDEGKEYIASGMVSGTLVGDVLTRSGERLLRCDDNQLAKEHIERMQAWLMKMHGEHLDSLAEYQNQLSVKRDIAQRT